MTDSMEGDLMDAMNAALLEDSASENLGSTSGHSSLLSVDVMDEAMLLLAGDGELAKSGDEDVDDDDDEEEINFEEFLATSTTKEKQEETNTNDGESDISPTSIIDGEKTKTKPVVVTESKAKSKQKSTKPEKESLTLQEPQVVPLKQFENALALIQDLENRIHVLETDQQCLLEENEQLRETTNNQASTIADMEEKLGRFPKLLEQTVQEESKMAAKQAEADTKVSFWKRDLARQEQEELEEKMKKNRVGKHGATTDSLKQSDFLAEVVERKETENPAPRVRPVAIFNAIRGFGNRIGGNQNRDGNTKELPTLPSMEVTSKGSKDPQEEEDANETNNVIEDDAGDSKVMDLMI